jgi:hypothetical protein
MCVGGVGLLITDRWPPITSHGPLFSAGMGFPVAGKQVVGPGTLPVGRGVGFAGGSGVGSGRAIPIRGWFGDSPNISGVVERHSDKKVFAVTAQRQAIGYAGRSASPTRQITQQHGSSDGQGLRCAESAALRTYDQGQALGGELVFPVHTDDRDGNLHTNSSAAPRRLGCEYFHLRDSLFRWKLHLKFGRRDGGWSLNKG